MTLPTAQLLAAVDNLNYKCESNIDVLNPSHPGTAAVWRSDLEVSQVNNLETCRLQSINIVNQTFFNVYAPSGSGNRRERNLLFSRDMFPHLLGLQDGFRPVLAGDWNCLIAPEDTTANYRDKFSIGLEGLVKLFKYTDSFRQLNPHKVEFTFYWASCSPARLDRVYLPPHLKLCLRSVSHQPGVADHWSVQVELQLDTAVPEAPSRRSQSH